MVQINFGNITNVGGRNVFLGSQSGLNTESLITAMTTAKRLPAVKLEETITSNKAKITALTEMKTALSALKDKLNGLRNPSGFGSSTQNIFDSRSTFASVSNGGTAANYVGVTTSNGAPLGKYSLQVLQLAQADKFESGNFTSRTESVVQAAGGSDNSMFTEGNFTISGGTGKDAVISIEAGDTLTDIAAEINAVTSQTDIQASIVKISDTSYKMVLTHRSTGASNDITITPDAGVMPVNGGFTETVDSKDAIITFNNQTITRSSNTISDILDNTTFTLYQTTGNDALTAATVTLDIDKNNETVASGIVDFLSAYNTVREFLGNQTAVDEDGKYLDTAVLYNNPTMRTVIDRLASSVNGQAAGITNPFAAASTNPIKMGDLGIFLTDIPAGTDGTNPTPEIKGVMDVDVSKLNGMIDKYFDNVRNIFEFKFSTNSQDLNILSRSNGVTATKFDIHINKTAPSGSQAWVTHVDGVALSSPVFLDYDSTTGLVKGKTGTGFAGLTTSYLSDSNTGSFTISNSDIEKKFTLNVNGTNAQVTKMFGYDLSAPVSMTYKAGSSSATITGTGNFAGIEMLYTGDGSDNINVSMGQGVADKMYNDLESILAQTEGLIDAEITSLQQTNEDMQESITKIDIQVEDFRMKQLDKFSALEAAISSANQLLALLEAQTNAQNK